MIILINNLKKFIFFIKLIIFKHEYFKIIKSVRFLLILFLSASFYIIYKYELNTYEKLNKKIESLPPFQREIINNLLNISSNFNKEKFQEIHDLMSFFSLRNFSKLSNETIKTELEIKLLNSLQKNPKESNSVDDNENKIAYVDKSFNFGNSMILLNNLLYYCEILNIKTIYLNENRKWPIYQNFTSNKINIFLISPLNCNLNEKNIYIFDKKLIYFQSIFKAEIRINLLKNQIKEFLPKTFINEEDLYIHVRSGDIFLYIDRKNMNYAQPPLCFYETVITNFKFRNIFILAVDKANPIINKLINHFPQIILTKNSLEKDISILSNAYNIIGSMSSFLTTLLIINENLKNFWEYDNYRLSQKYLHLHHDIYQYPINFTIYKMKSSLQYMKAMFPWRSNKEQIDLMLNEKCNNKFEVFENNGNY